MSELDDSGAIADAAMAGLQRIVSSVDQVLRSGGEARLLEWLASIPEERSDAEYLEAGEGLREAFEGLPPDVVRVAHVVCRFLCTHWEGSKLLNEWWADSASPVPGDEAAMPVPPVKLVKYEEGQDCGLPPGALDMAMRVTRALPDIIEMHRAGAGAQEIAVKLEIEQNLVQNIIDIGEKKRKRMI